MKDADEQYDSHQQITKIIADPKDTTSQWLLHRKMFKTERSRNGIIATVKLPLFCEKWTSLQRSQKHHSLEMARPVMDRDVIHQDLLVSVNNINSFSLRGILSKNEGFCYHNLWSRSLTICKNVLKGVISDSSQRSPLKNTSNLLIQYRNRRVSFIVSKTHSGIVGTISYSQWHMYRITCLKRRSEPEQG